MTSAVLGIDYGLARVGLALAEDGEIRRIATLPNDDRLLEALTETCQAHGVSCVVVGLPRNHEGNDTPWTSEVRVFAHELQEATNTTVELQDEFGTTEAARSQLQSQKVSEREQKELIDQEAAAIILRDYLAQ